jgi:hypothetical protein
MLPSRTLMPTFQRHACARLSLRLACILAAMSAGCEPGQNPQDLDITTVAQPIVNGQVDDQNRYPYVDRVSTTLANGGGLVCSGVVIGLRTVLTAAHCVPPGSTASYGTGRYHPRLDVTQSVRHPDYREGNFEHDIAVLYLQSEAGVPRVPLEYFMTHQQTMTFVGLGGTSSDGHVPLDDIRRYASFSAEPTSDGKQIRGSDPDKTVAGGDSGGAVVAGGRLVGVIVADKDGSLIAPARSTAVPINRHLDWILDRMFDNHDGVSVYWSSSTMTKGESLLPGESIYSENRFARLTMEVNGELRIYRGNRKVWGSGTSGTPAYAATMQGDGNLVLYDRLGTAFWAPNLFDSSGNPSLVLQNDGNLVLYSGGGSSYWASYTVLPAPSRCRRMLPDEALSIGGQSLYSCNGQHRLTMQSDGNLVLYSASPTPPGYVARWSSVTYGSTGYVATVQPDGNFVLYNLVDSPLWSTGTFRSGAYVDLQNDGNLVVYPAGGGAALWASNSTLPGPESCGGLGPGHALNNGQSLYSCNGQFRLTMQSDGNLVLYAGSRALWASNTYGSGGYVATITNLADFVVYGLPDDGPRWSTNTLGGPSAHLALQDDGNIVLYNGAGGVLWQTGPHNAPPPPPPPPTPVPDPLPSGPYQSSCWSCESDGDSVACDCRTRSGSSRRSLLFLPCYQGINNCDGLLTCGQCPPQGTYEQSCYGCIVQGTQLACQCLDQQGNGHFTTLPLPCNASDIPNCNGLLSCGPCPAPACQGVRCGSNCCAAGSWCGTGSRCCTGCSAGCPC